MDMDRATAGMGTYHYPYAPYTPPPLPANSTYMTRPVLPVVMMSKPGTPREPSTSAASLSTVCAVHPLAKDWGRKMVPLRTQRADPGSKVNTRVGEQAFSSCFPIRSKPNRGELGLGELSSRWCEDPTAASLSGLRGYLWIKQVSLAMSCGMNREMTERRIWWKVWRFESRAIKVEGRSGWRI